MDNTPVTLAITCTAGVESLVKDEIKRSGYRYADVYDRIVYMTGDETAIARMNLFSRVGNRVHYEVGRFVTSDFDTLFDSVRSLDWSRYISRGMRVVTDAVSIRSTLMSIPTIQAVAKKAIVRSITKGIDAMLPEYDDASECHILLMLRDDICSILIDTTGPALHKRGYRRDDSGEAPIKESLAASLVLLSGWSPETPFWDVCAGSGTIAIEAALIARDMAPGLVRHFAFENFGWYNPATLRSERDRARIRIRTHASSPIRATDRDTESIARAREHARIAGVERDITFSIREIGEYLSDDTPMIGTLVSNPPYGLRITDVRLDDTYRDIAQIFARNPSLGGGIITSYTGWEHAIHRDNWRKRKLYNGNERCDFYTKKPIGV